MLHLILNRFIKIIFLDSTFIRNEGNDSNLLIVFYVQIMPDDFVMQLHRF
ncbi:aldehyde dehydrogenase [Escherichia coli]|nr:aldehyde dehydrogenase [Escherichia coli]